MLLSCNKILTTCGLQSFDGQDHISIYFCSPIKQRVYNFLIVSRIQLMHIYQMFVKNTYAYRKDRTFFNGILVIIECNNYT